MNSERFSTPPQVAKLLGVNVDKVLTWIRKGELRAVNTADTSARARWKISPDDLQSFLEKRSNQVATKKLPRVIRRIPKPSKIYV